MDDPILDEELNLTNQLGQSVRFWEKRRITYNVLVGVCGFIILIIYWKYTRWYDVVFASIYAIIMNLAYMTGFYLETLDLHFLNSRFSIHRRRPTLFILGTILACIFTLLAGFIAFEITT